MKRLLLILSIFILLFVWMIYQPIVVTKEVKMELAETFDINPLSFIDLNKSKHIQKQDFTFEKADFKNEVGQYEITILYHHQLFHTTLTIKDTTPPKFIDFPTSLELEKEEDILSYFHAEDLSEMNLSILKVEDNIYSIKAEDIYGNQNIKECEITFKNEKTASPLDPNRPSNISIQESTESTKQKEENSIISNNQNDRSSSPPSSTSNETTEAPVYVCEYSGPVGNSQKTFGSYGEATSWAESVLMNNLMTYSGYSLEKIGCPDIWTVSFY